MYIRLLLALLVFGFCALISQAACAVASVEEYKCEKADAAYHFLFLQEGKTRNPVFCSIKEPGKNDKTEKSFEECWKKMALLQMDNFKCQAENENLF